MEQFLKSVGPLIGAIVAFLIGYIRLKERVSSVEATIKAIDKKLEEVLFTLCSGLFFIWLYDIKDTYLSYLLPRKKQWKK